VYVTDALKAVAENTAKYAGGGYIKARYIEIIDPPKEETRTGEEIITQMKAKLGQIGGEPGESA
jgi:hypothetical protein